MNEINEMMIVLDKNSNRLFTSVKHETIASAMLRKFVRVEFVFGGNWRLALLVRV